MDGLAPELQILILNAVVLLVAYLGIYPTMGKLTVGRMMLADAVLMALVLLVAGGLFMGSGVAFSLVLFSTNWVVFTLVTGFVMEWPLFLWFCRRHGLDPFRMDGDDG